MKSFGIPSKQAAKEKPPWRPLGLGHDHHAPNEISTWPQQGHYENDNKNNKIVRHHASDKKRVSFANLNRNNFGHDVFEKLDLDEKMKRRNLQVSEPLFNNSKFKSKRFGQNFADLSETRQYFLGRHQINNSGYKAIINNNMSEMNEKASSSEESLVMVKPAIDVSTILKIQSMKNSVLSGKHVSMDDIRALKNKANNKLQGAYQYEFVSMKSRSQKSNNNSRKQPKIIRSPLFCTKGIISIPTPHKPITKNSFGTPADLRISLSNSDCPEFQGRRRFFFDFTGFSDEDIQLFLEGSNRLVIQVDQPEGGSEKPPLKTDFIDLPSDLTVDNLRIVRDVFGTLIVEEAWKFQ